MTTSISIMCIIKSVLHSLKLNSIYTCEYDGQKREKYDDTFNVSRERSVMLV